MATRTPVTPFYAIAGAGDVAVEKLRAVGEDVAHRLAKLDQKTLQTELTKAQAELTKRFEALLAEAKTAPAKLRETAPAKLRELPAVAQAKTTASKAKATRTTAKKTAGTTARTVKATATSARKTAKSASKAATDAADKIGD